MRKKSIIFTTLGLLLSTLFINSPVFAGDIEWSGLYRIEGYQIHNSEMRSSDRRQIDYALSHLVLRPKIVAGDGFTIYSQFDVFNSSTYPNSQMGQVWGNGVGNNAGLPATSASNSSSLLGNQAAETINLTELYLTYSHEFGQLIVGRVPMQFGLGMTYNAGHGLFDHWYDTRDLVGYKIILGNVYILPMIGKPSGGARDANGNIGINKSSDINEYMIQLQYENPESDIEMGIIYAWEKSGDQAADAPTGIGGAGLPGSVLGGPGPYSTTGIDAKTINVYALRDTPRFRIGMEASFMSGNTGIVDSAAEKVAWGGFGIATEFEYRPEGSSFKWGLKMGSASGDDPTTPGKFEGYIFNRNYDVAMLLFNHPLGAADFLRSGLVTGGYVPGGNGVCDLTPGQCNISKTDVEAISNAFYVAPIMKYAFNDHWSMDNTLVTGFLETNPMPGQMHKDLGYEWDIAINFSPRKGIMWSNQMGILLPGGAWLGDGSQTAGVNNYDNQVVYGFGTKAAISF